mmetsp:Transcript_109972/g.200165  ORF Transcript_109972/g.200165 Transcript_109972/m.200165 type:complete len:273 (-) Transcript_109972:60-878(-)
MVQIHVKTMSGEPVMDAIDGPITVEELRQMLAGTHSTDFKKVPQFALDASLLSADDVVGGEGDAEVELNVVWLTALQAANNELKSAQQMLERAEDAIIELELPCFEADFLEADGNPFSITANRTANLEKELTAALVHMDSMRSENNHCRRRADFIEARLQADFLEAAGELEGLPETGTDDLDDKLKAAHMHMERMRQNVVKAERVYHETAVACWKLLHPKIAQAAEFQSDFGTKHVRPAAEQLGIVLSDDDLEQIIYAARTGAGLQFHESVR